MSFRRKSSYHSRYEKPAAKSSPPRHRFRVRLRRQSGAAEVVWLTNDLEYARQITDCLNSQGGPTPAWVDQWEPSGHPPRWRWVYPTLASEVREERPWSTRVRPLRSGEIVEAVLLAQRTRRGGWKAQLTESGLVGPITNSDLVPPTAKANTTVWLRVGAANLDGTHIQLVWAT